MRTIPGATRNDVRGATTIGGKLSWQQAIVPGGKAN
jgi:hypothetical protein